MLKATIDADIFREAIDAISALIPECRLHTDETGISTRAVDTANVAMVALTLKKEAFDTFKATKSQLGIDLMKMKSIFGMAAINGVRRAADIELAAIARCTTRKSVHQ